MKKGNTPIKKLRVINLRIKYKSEADYNTLR